MVRQGWQEEDVPEVAGRTYVVTGANSGIGLEASRVLAERGAHVVLACRRPEPAQAAVARILRTAPSADLEVEALDLGDLTSVRAAAAHLVERHPRLDGLVNNAGIMAPPLGRTADGFETQLGVNHLGHFALTLGLLPSLLATPGSRVVTVSSVGHRWGTIDLTDPAYERRRYARWQAYGQSKLANLLFTSELQRRFAAGGYDALALAAHPGFARTELGVGEIPGMSIARTLVFPFLTHSAAAGAVPTLRALTDPDARGDEYFGPGGRGEQRGPAVRVGRSARAQDAAMARALWDLSLRLTGADDRLLMPQPA